MSKQLVKLYEFPENRPEMHVGSVWQTKTRRHNAQRRVIVGVNKNRTSVFVRALTRVPAQHKDKTYTVNAEVFIREHEPLF